MLCRMTYLDYQKKSASTKIYLPEVSIQYLILGLIGEFGEIYDELSNEEILEPSKEQNLAKEIGDYCWYAALICEDFGFDISKVFQTSRPPVTEKADHEEILNRLFKISELTKKYFRDEYPGEMSATRKDQIAINLAESMFLLRRLVHDFTIYDFDEILAMNVQKLQDRKDRGVLSGSGNNR